MKKQIFALCLCVFALSAAYAAVDPVSSERLELKAGWNLVTLTRPIVEEHVVRFLGLHPVTLSADGARYVRCADRNDIRIGVGYWIFSQKDQEIEFAHDQAQKTWTTAGLSAGWNLIGVAKDSTWQADAGEIWQWRNGVFSLVAKDKLKSGDAYFVIYEK